LDEVNGDRFVFREDSQFGESVGGSARQQFGAGSHGGVDRATAFVRVIDVKLFMSAFSGTNPGRTGRTEHIEHVVRRDVRWHSSAYSPCHRPIHKPQ
jgi:hypothetical protein